MGLFEYAALSENNGMFNFSGVRFIRMFPGYMPTSDDITVIINPFKGTVWAFTGFMNISKEITINEWLISHLTRTDNMKFQFF